MAKAISVEKGFTAEALVLYLGEIPDYIDKKDLGLMLGTQEMPVVIQATNKMQFLTPDQREVSPLLDICHCNTLLMSSPAPQPAQFGPRSPKPQLLNRRSLK